MTRTLIGVTLDCNDVALIASFWGRALGYDSRGPVDPDKQFNTLFAPADHGLHHLTLQRVAEPKSGKVRAHIDLFVDDLHAEIARLVSIGASVLVPVDPAASFQSAVLADPEGHEFCVAAR